MWLNFPDRQIGLIDTTKTAQPVIAVRFFSTAANYAGGDFVVQAGGIWVAKASVTAGAFNPTQWNELAYLTDIPAIYVLPIASTSVLGGVKVDGITVKADASGVLTAAGLVTVSSVAPSPVQNGALWYDLNGGQLYEWVNDGTSSQWVIAVNTGGSSGASITIGDTPPAGPLTGALWFDSVGGQLYVWYNDGGSNQWVPTTNQIGGGGYQLSTGVTDGSNAAAGQIGEYVFASVAGVALTNSVYANVISTFSLTAGDWDVGGNISIVASVASSNAQGGVTLNSAGNPGSLKSGAMTSTTASIPTYSFAVPMQRLSLTAPTTSVYLTAFAAFASGTCAVSGNIWARRAR